jgi:acetyl-CoA/propionyl-CoA carboxylase biotin carboxyl carrier protein
MEMNTRLQVEHPVTEMVTGWDLVETQIRVAAGEPLPQKEGPIPAHGHAIEARVYAEDPVRGFLPSSGRVLLWREPHDRPGVRVDAGVWTGSRVGTHYDPLLAKVIAWGADRAEALARLRAALAEVTVLGVTTNVAFLRDLLAGPDVVAGRLDTELIDRLAPTLTTGQRVDEAAVAASLLRTAQAEPAGSIVDPWDLPGGWRLGRPAETVYPLRIDGQPVEVGVGGRAVAAVVRVGDGEPAPAVARLERDLWWVEVGGVARRYWWAADADRWWLARHGRAWLVQADHEAERGAAGAASDGGPVLSPMPGTVLAVAVGAGDAVAAGQALVVVEAMKMEHTVTAPVDGIVTEVLVRPGQAVTLDQALAVVKSS